MGGTQKLCNIFSILCAIKDEKKEESSRFSSQICHNSS